MFGGSKKKLQAATSANDALEREIEQKQAELAKLRQEIQTCDAEAKSIGDKITTEREKKTTVDVENAGLKKELALVNSQSEDLRRKVAEAKLSMEAARKEKEDLHVKLGRFEGLVKEQHESAKKSAELAQRETLALRQEQEKERQIWQDTKLAHEELLRQSEIDSQKIAQAQSELENTKKEHAATREALQDLTRATGRLREDHQVNERRLEEQQGKCQKLEAEISSIEQEIARTIEDHKELEGAHRERQAQLHSVTTDLNQKKDFLQSELNKFEQQFQEAKGHRENILGESDRVRNDMGVFLPEYFNLQTEHAQNQRELELVKRQMETLQWEHHKVGRDLDMLAKSYDASYLASLSPAKS